MAKKTAKKKAKAFTVNELKELCEAEILRGNGEKIILISNDDEGNGFHELFFSFTEAKEFSGVVDFMNLPMGVNEKDFLKKYIVLG